MHIDISAQHTQLTPALEAAVHEKFQRFADHADKPLRVHVALVVDGAGHRVEATVRGAGRPIAATSTSDNMYTSINQVSHLIDRQWRKRKTSKLSKQHRATPLKRMGI